MGGLEYLLDPNRRIFWLYLLSSFVLGAIWLYFNPKKRRILLSKKLWLHPSARLDYIFFIVSFFIKTFLIIPIIIGAKDVALFVMGFLVENFGFRQVNLDYNLIIILFTCTLFIISDFSRYWLHRFLHINAFLWEIHKIHHSAKVLTPLTFYRVHPIENLLFGLRYSLVIGLVTGVFVYFFGAKIGLIEIFGVNIFVFLFSFIGSNLRHSHIEFSYPNWCEKWLISPKQHQMHHSIDYVNKNYGGYFSIWDKIFGTIAYSNQSKKLKFGLKEKKQMDLYGSIFDLLFTPFIFKRRLS